MTQVPWLELMPKLPAMLGTDTLAMVMSSTAMKLAPASTMATSHSIAPLRGASPFSAFSNSVITLSLSSIYLSTTTAGIDGRFHGQPHLQRPGRELGRVDADADRHALHHLDPVAGGVLRGDGREGRTGAARQSLDHAVIGHGAAVQV